MNGNGQPNNIMSPQQAAAHDRFVHHRDVAVSAIRAGCTDAVVILSNRESHSLCVLTIGKFAPSMLAEALNQNGKLAKIVFVALEMPFEMERQRRIAEKRANEAKGHDS